MAVQGMPPGLRAHEHAVPPIASRHGDASLQAAASNGICLPRTPAIDIKVADWEVLFNAVKARLRLCVGTRPACAAGSSVLEAASVIETHVLECMTVLEQMQATWLRDRRRLQELELEAFDTYAALAQARVDLASTRAGERQARHQALHDGLTLLPNRRHFCEHLGRALTDLAAPADLAVLYLDLDGFKAINDCHGHDVGDEMLRIIAMRLNRVVRKEDMVSRLGGDEFACLRAGPPNRQQLAQLADKLFEAVSAPLKVGELALSIRPSIGIAICPPDGTTALALLKSADLAMYDAKRRQTRFAFCDQALSAAGGLV
jgi:diguanylate cyclase (GGDEF)-like protein